MSTTFKTNVNNLKTNVKLVQPLDSFLLPPETVYKKTVYNVEAPANYSVYNVEAPANYSVKLLPTINYPFITGILFVKTVIYMVSFLITTHMASRGSASGAGSITEKQVITTGHSSPVKSASPSIKGSQQAGGSGDGGEEKRTISEVGSSHRIEFETPHSLALFLISILERKKKKVPNAQYWRLTRAMQNPEFKQHLENEGIMVITSQNESIYHSTLPNFGDNILIVYDCGEGFPRWVCLVQRNGASEFVADYRGPLRDKVRRHVDCLFSNRGSVAQSINDEDPFSPENQAVGRWLEQSTAERIAGRPPLHPQSVMAQPVATPVDPVSPELTQLLTRLLQPGSNTLNVTVSGSTSIQAPNTLNTSVGQPSNVDQAAVQSNYQSAAQANSQQAQLAQLTQQAVVPTVQSMNTFYNIVTTLLAAGGAGLLLHALQPGLVAFSTRNARRGNRQLGLNRGEQNFIDAVTTHNSQLLNIFNQIKLPSVMPLASSHHEDIEDSLDFQEGENAGFRVTRRNHAREHPTQRTRIIALNPPSRESSTQRPPRGVSPVGVTLGVLLDVCALVLGLARRRRNK